MSFSFSSLIRLTAFLAIGATMCAVGLSRVDRPSNGSRTRHMSSLVNVNDYYMKDDAGHPHWFDVDTAKIIPMPVKSGDVMEAASLSPWKDEHGQGQVVGRWSVRSQRGPLSTSVDFGLGRYSYPDGKLLDHVSTDIMPIAPPAWYPGTKPRILFASGDGRLYDFSFENDRGETGVNPRPRVIDWKCPSPGHGEPYISEVQWSDDPQMNGCLVVTLRRRIKEADGSLSYGRTQLWWLKLDQTGTSVRDSGKLIEGSDDHHDERGPSFASLPDGRLVAAYLRQDVGTTHWQAFVGEIRLKEGALIPEVHPESIRCLETRVQPSVTGFSRNGRYLAVVIGQSADQARPARLSTEKALFPANPLVSLADSASTRP